MATEEKPEDFDGYFPDDGYDYTQHLREINPIRFVEAKVRPVKKAPSHKSKELSDVMAALAGNAAFDEVDDSFRFNLGVLDARTRIGMLWGEDQVDEYLSMPTERLMAIKERLDERERLANQEEGMGDEEFEEFFAREFQDERIGGLSACAVDVLEGSDCSDDDDEYSEFDEQDEVPPKLEDLEEIRAEGLEETKRFIAQHDELQRSVIYANEDDYKDLEIPSKNIPDWDCESVLSLRSNTCNHPGMIFRPPKDITRKKPSLAPIVQEEDVETITEDVETPVREVNTFRPKNETAEERKARKQAVKQFQRDQRSSKKKEENERKQTVNKAKIEVAFNKHATYGDVRAGTSKFTI